MYSGERTRGLLMDFGGEAAASEHRASEVAGNRRRLRQSPGWAVAAEQGLLAWLPLFSPVPQGLVQPYSILPHPTEEWTLLQRTV